MGHSPEIGRGPDGSAGRSRKRRILAIGLGGVVVVGAFVLTLIFVIFSGIKSAPVSRTAIERARTNAEVADAIGLPVQTGRWVSGSISVTGPSGQADLAIPLNGSHGHGTLYLRAEKIAGEWHYKLLELAVEGKEGRIQLLTGTESGAVQSPR